MTTAKHTPGPWSVAPRVGRYQVIPATEHERIQLASINGLEFEALSVGGANRQMAIIPLDESNIDNANLIAAAPEMLEAIEKLLILAGDRLSITETYAMRDLLAAAKGQSK